jgi:hypothetical protein
MTHLMHNPYNPYRTRIDGVFSTRTTRTPKGGAVSYGFPPDGVRTGYGIRFTNHSHPAIDEENTQ